jgi:hypothetical protein
MRRSGAKGQKLKIQEEKQAVPQAKRSKAFPFRKMMNVLGSFQFKVFRLHIHTGDYPLNGLLFPFFFCLSKWSGKDFQVNFDNRNELVMHVENSVIRIIRAYLRPSKK